MFDVRAKIAEMKKIGDYHYNKKGKVLEIERNRDLRDCLKIMEGINKHFLSIIS